MKRESLIIFYDVGSLRRYLGLAVVRQTLDVRKFRSVSLIYAQKPRNSSLQGDPPGVQRWEPNPSATSELGAKPASTAPRQQVKSGAKVLQNFTRSRWIFTHASSCVDHSCVDHLSVDHCAGDLMSRWLIFIRSS